MILAVDIGNSNICFGGMEGLELRFFGRVLSRRQATADEYLMQLTSLLRRFGLRADEVEGAIISSVVPELTDVLTDVCAGLLGKEPLIAGAGMDTGYAFAVPAPEKLGKDRLVDTTAALALYADGGPVVTVDCGTATTISVIDGQRRFVGGLIIPGIKTSLNALAAKAAQLPPIPLTAPEQLLGVDAVSCMNAGIVYGTASMLDGLIQRIGDELGQMPAAVITGGLSQYIVPHCRQPFIYDENLLLKGLAVLYRRNAG